MSAQRFQISTINPNDAVGGGGCACSETKVPDCLGPFVVFYSEEMASNISPHVVVCRKCVKAADRQMDLEALGAGETGPATPQSNAGAVEIPAIDGEAEELVDDSSASVLSRLFKKPEPAGTPDV